MKKSKKTFAMNDDYLSEVISVSSEEHIPEPASSFPEEDAPEADTPGLSRQTEQIVRGISGARTERQVYSIDIRQLEAYPNQPFKMYSLEQLQELAEDIGKVGILSPILTRAVRNRLQILSGHNRWQAAKLAGLTHVPAIVLDADDDMAALVLTSANLRQREHLLPSEKAFAFKMQMDALKRQGTRTGTAYDSSAFITRQTGESKTQIHRYIRLTGLIPELLDLLDRGNISMTPAVNVSFLCEKAQRTVLECITKLNAVLTIDKSRRLKSLADCRMEMPEDMLLEEIRGELLRPKPGLRSTETVPIRMDRIGMYLPRGIQPEEIEDLIVDILKERMVNA